MSLSSSAYPAFDLIAAPFTPFDQDGNVRHATIRAQAEKLIRDGVSGAFICGTTGEGMSLSLEERESVAETWREVATGTSLKVIVHVGHTSLPESIRLARHAALIRCDAIASIGSCFFGPTSAESQVRMFAEIAATTELPFYYYHMPSMTRVSQKASELLPLLAEIPTFKGIKFTHNDVADFALCVRMAGGAHEMLFGRDELLLDGIKAGASGAVGSTYNYATPIYQEIIAAMRAGDEAKAAVYQRKATQFIDIFSKYGGLEAGKALMNMCGVNCGKLRLPLEALTPAASESMRQELEASGFFQDVLAAR